MANDLVFIGKKLINICDMSNFIFMNTIEKEKIKVNENEIKRYLVKLKKVDIMKKLNNTYSITKEIIDFNLNSYLEYLGRYIDTNKEFISNDEKEHIENIISNYNKLEDWISEIKIIIENKAKADDLFLFLYDFGYEEALFKDYEPKNELQKFLLRKNITTFSYNIDRESLYNIPFLNDNEFLAMMLLLVYDTEEDITIDISERYINKLSKINEERDKKPKTYELNKFEKKYYEIISKIDDYENDTIVKQLLLVQLISMFENYMENIIRYAVNKSDYYLKLLIENDTEFNKADTKITYRDYFESFKKLKEDVNTYIDTKNFMSIKKIKQYLKKIITIYSDDELNKFTIEYKKIVELRNIIAHDNGYDKDGEMVEISSDELKEYYFEIYELVKKIDIKIIVSLI
ncbi:HEPN domain-containing protein [Clostridium beijerinckii]|uniref:RiboL-PSP-HEPN domain-containing protein n=1 Tax=Clostridium beijerinckii TaxID=1520 RepID=A0AAW3WAF5_CLOBE|nr:HEPN domain-containing protein [Clostridium beijerinckii]MBC2457020.1 hypothetical protein [Clostridium beijerinckii]MBC2475592.1 hypothetical protein [Clostridium beijerinckii]NOV63106.1 hypothetical protein [Clostridium beijerinckii]NOV69932.1 hypothetical protein [Clostridium beijerinckii]NOW31161.1 hypothetical protein [Clostridium beijerinckii]